MLLAVSKIIRSSIYNYPSVDYETGISELKEFEYLGDY